MKVKIGKYKDDGSERTIKVKISSTDCFSLDHTLSIVILAALRKYREVASKVIVIEGEFEEALNDMIVAFELIEASKNYDFDDEVNAKIDKGLKAFAEHYLHLWY